MKYPQKCFDGDDPRILVTKKFIDTNHLRIDLDAVRKIFADAANDFFGFRRDAVSDLLPYAEFKSLFSSPDDAPAENDYRQIVDVAEVTQDFLDYMVFAWTKARDCRGLSAGRSIEKLSSWMKALSRPDVAAVLLDDSLYDSYGKPALRKACEMLGIAVPDDIR